ncbi:MAG: MobF family relaxase [Egibacteraceae bacterium]
MVASIGKLTVGGNSGEYYLERVATGRHDYYTGHGEAPGYWAGAAAGTLNLDGQVEAEAFRAVLAGRHPDTGAQLKRWRNSATLGIDVTFSAPKSVSVLYALADPEERAVIAAAQAEAVGAGLEYLERRACVARLGSAGKDRQPGEGFIAACFAHRTSRAGDPQLHTHTVIANIVATADGRVSAADSGLIYRNCKAAGALYDARLRAALTRDLALSWEQRSRSLEVAGVPAGLCHYWSKRRRQIEAKLAEWGQTSGRAAQAAALNTRQAKDDTADADLHARLRAEAAHWQPQPSRPGMDVDRIVAAAAAAPDSQARPSDEEIVETLTGPDGLTEKASSFAERDVTIQVAALLHPADATGERIGAVVGRVLSDEAVVDLLAPGRPTSGEVLAVRDNDGRVVRTVCTARERRWTTAGLVAAETESLDLVRAGLGVGVARIDPTLVEAALAGHRAANPDRELDADQAGAVRGLCASGNSVDVVRGRAGTGKSSMLAVYRQICDQAGIAVIGVAPTARAAHLLGVSAGIAEAGTAHRLLAQLDRGEVTLAEGGVVVCDEAGMADTRTLLALQRAAAAAGGKLVLAGDERQIPSVDVGGLLPRIAQITATFELTHNHRFADIAQRDAAEAIRDGDTAAGIAALRRLGMVCEWQRAADAWDVMVNDWAGLRAAGADARMFADTNSVVDDLNLRARRLLVAAGDIDPHGQMFCDDESGRWVQLSVGDQVRLGRNCARVPQADGGGVAVRNGMEGAITHVDRDGVIVTLDAEHADGGGREQVWLPGLYVGRHVGYAYAVSCHKAQAATVDHCLYAATDQASRETGYVALSRGRHSNRIYAAAGSGWEEALGESRAHDLAIDQAPGTRDVASRDGYAGGLRAAEVSSRERWLRERDAERERACGRAMAM